MCESAGGWLGSLIHKENKTILTWEISVNHPNVHFFYGKSKTKVIRHTVVVFKKAKCIFSYTVTYSLSSFLSHTYLCHYIYYSLPRASMGNTYLAVAFLPHSFGMEFSVTVPFTQTISDREEKVSPFYKETYNLQSNTRKQFGI